MMTLTLTPPPPQVINGEMSRLIQMMKMALTKTLLKLVAGEMTVVTQMDLKKKTTALPMTLPWLVVGEVTVLTTMKLEKKTMDLTKTPARLVAGEVMVVTQMDLKKTPA
jgi:hypothetical protein